MTSLRARRHFRWAAPGIAVALALLVFASLDGCGSKDSLILVTVSAADYSVSGLRTLVVTCRGTTQVFHLSTQITTTPIEVGLYVPSSTTGRQTVTAQAISQSGQCGPGYSGSMVVNIPAAGATATTAIVMTDATTCPPASSGSGGSGGSPACTASAQPPAGTPPQFGCCIEYSQDTSPVCGSNGSEIEAVAFSPDGKTLVTAAGTVGNNVKVWGFNGHTLTDKGIVLPSDGWRALAFSADGTLLAIPVTDGVDLWNTADWSFNTTLLGGSNFFIGAAFTPDQTHIIALDQNANVTPFSGSLYLFDLNAATPEVPVKIVALPGGPDGMAVAAKAVGGQTGVAVTYSDGRMDVFSYANGAFSAPTGLVVDAGGSAVWDAAFTPDGSLLAAGDSSSKIHFWAFPVPATLAESGAQITFSPADNTDIIYALDFSPNGNYLAAGGGDSAVDQYDSRAVLFSATSRSQLAGATSTHDVVSIAFSPVGNAVAGGEIDCGTLFVCTN